MEPVHITRKRKNREDLKQQILEAALQLAVKENWEAVTIRRIAEAVAYTTTVVYSHFENKETLLQQISNNGFEELYQRFQRLVPGDQAPDEQLLSLSLIIWDFAAENKALYKLMFSFKHPSFETVKAMRVVEDIFQNLTGKTGYEREKLILNWICLRQGCIATLLNLESGSGKILDGHAPKQLYIEFINCFIQTIATL